MKKLIKYLVLALVVLLPFCVNAKENVSITKIERTNLSGGAIEVEPATFEGLKASFNLKFGTKNDSVTYKVTIKNSDNEDYELSGEKDFSKNKYITYTVEYNGGNTIKANSEKTATITITYANEVPDEMLNDEGKFVEENEMSISLSNGEKQIVNPKTSGRIIILGFIALLLVVGTIIVIKGSTKTKLLTILVGLLLLPITTFAITKLTITVDSKVEVVKLEEFCLIDMVEEKPFQRTYYLYEKGMKWSEYKTSEYAEIPNIWSYSQGVYTKSMLEISEIQMPSTCIDTWEQYYNGDLDSEPNCTVPALSPLDSLDVAIKNKDTACYTIRTQLPKSGEK